MQVKQLQHKKQTTTLIYFFTIHAYAIDNLLTVFNAAYIFSLLEKGRHILVKSQPLVDEKGQEEEEAPRETPDQRITRQ